MNMTKHLVKSKNLDEYGSIIDIIFIDNHFILLSNRYKSKTHCEIIKTNFSNYKNTYNLLEQSKIFPLNFLQKINDSTLFINSFFDFTKEYFNMKGIDTIFPVESLKNRKYKTKQGEDFILDFYWYNEQKYIALSWRNNFNQLRTSWFKKDYKFKITIFNNDNIEIKDFPLIYREKQNLVSYLFSKNENLISRINQYQFHKEYFVFIASYDLFVVNVNTTKIIRYKLDSIFYVIQEINDQKEILISSKKNIILMKFDSDYLIKIFDLNLKYTIKAAKLLNEKLIVVFPKAVIVYNKLDLTIEKHYGFTKIYFQKILHMTDNKFAIIYTVHNKSIFRSKQISFLET